MRLLRRRRTLLLRRGHRRAHNSRDLLCLARRAHGVPLLGRNDAKKILDPNDLRIRNIGNETINLHWASFTDGIYFTFTYLELAPGGHDGRGRPGALLLELLAQCRRLLSGMGGANRSEAREPLAVHGAQDSQGGAGVRGAVGRRPEAIAPQPRPEA